ncbi:unnamed protein product [Trichogramma brassicae]|uniref:Carbonic anhydrase n=1 Tax=Trichogramma brassicae TaxID=86971 RepID=A0A6H5J224_9HYME|nr:unnamed protein product [Trichogramma brassicae]
MDRIIKGVMKYRKCHREGMVKQFQQVRDNPQPKAVFFTCMDSRMIPTRFTETNVGDMFVVRNAGNIVPHSSHFMDELTMCEPAALELGCVVNDIRHIIICGHSDCKAMNLLYALRDQEFASQIVAYIDPENRFAVEDKLSQVNTLQQLQNVASYGFLKKRLETHDLHIHAIWFDIYTGDIYYFSRAHKRFVEINELNETPILKEIKTYYS